MEDKLNEIPVKSIIQLEFVIITKFFKTCNYKKKFIYFFMKKKKLAEF